MPMSRIIAFGVAAALVVYSGGVLVGSVMMTTAVDAGDRRFSAVVLGAVVVFGALGSALLAQVVRRPAIAEDAQSLVDDSLLRREDAVKAVEPFPAVVALIAALDSALGLSRVAYLAYGLLAFVVWLLARSAAARARPPAIETHVGQSPA